MSESVAVPIRDGRSRARGFGLVKAGVALGASAVGAPALVADRTPARGVAAKHGRALGALRRRDLGFAIKHGLDRVLAAWLLLVLAPTLILLTIAVRLSSPGPALFRQRRVSRAGVAFEMLKFRTMYLADPARAPAHPPAGLAPGGVEGTDRRTRLGRLLRRTSLDELPQLVNVLRGEMSLVGPRPERPELVKAIQMQLPLYNQRHRVKAGITGLAQVNGLRGKSPLADRLQYDRYYIAHWSFGMDLKILAMTVFALYNTNE